MHKCKGCGQEIIWLKTDNGKMMPADPKLLKMLVLNSDQTVTVKTAYTPHWATCPKAAQFKKAKQ
ncbi:MAG: hypothetical protein WC454_09320 [Phycisphaerae bacterium]|jgi:hypothetical protein